MKAASSAARTSGGPLDEAARQAIIDSPLSLRALARQLGINPKTVAKWKSRGSPESRPVAPRPGAARRLTADEETIVVGFRNHTGLPLDDCLFSLQARIPHLTRSTLYRCLVRHGIGPLPKGSQGPARTGQSPDIPLGIFHVDVLEVPTREGPVHLFVAMERASRFVFLQLASHRGVARAAAFLAALAQAGPMRVRTVITSGTPPFGSGGKRPLFQRACRRLGIAEQTMPARNPGAGAMARIGRSARATMAERTDYASHDHLARDLADFVEAYNHRRRLKTLGGLSPGDYLFRRWQSEPESFLREPVSSTARRHLHHGLVKP